MQIYTSVSNVGNWVGDGCAIAIFKNEPLLTPELIALDQQIFAGTLQDLITENEFKADAESNVSSRLSVGSPIRKVLLLGLGDRNKVTLETWRKASAQAVKWAEQNKCKTLALAFPLDNSKKEEEFATTQAIAEGIILAAHKDKRFKSDQKGNGKLENIEILGTDSDAAKAGIAQAQKICSGVILARELVAAPANIVTPQALATEAQVIADAYTYVSLEVLEKADCEALGMGAFLGVSQASDLPPKFIHLTYRPQTVTKKLGIIGKGVTFDSGGLNIKAGPGSSIEMMKMDMGGAAAMLGAAKAIAQIQPDGIEVHFISAVCENMINGNALHPGDILTASNGKTIEVNNTDAEGRLTLADALVFADKLGLDAIVDLATLTGAIIISLGTTMAGYWANDDELATKIETAASTAGEKFWRMPLEESYFDKMKSVVADFKNTGSREGGSITAALFLKQFIDKTPAWAHLDIAGPVWADKDSGYTNVGGTGYPVRTLVNLILNF
ncbi:leucyl aminopeptidase [Synechococcus sp. PCC 7502]|uniref:leucyl aminopeptidase n=1 Tax=Synechococcus sp. PCC 7502 TaxID=1173263 RepID=UPI00029FBC6A|nr:leucyl aminopeptidase [Synechococcus sp. PCC 7502]AFY72498.1 leucyl aminopeptidase [Synechococcus sp. PCC 7502]